jgi:hypothetical protein
MHGWRPLPLTTPSLLVVAGKPVDGMPDEWRTSRSVPHERAEVPGDHFSMLDQHATETAQAVRAWADALPTVPGNSAGQPAAGD